MAPSPLAEADASPNEEDASGGHVGLGVGCSGLDLEL